MVCNNFVYKNQRVLRAETVYLALFFLSEEQLVLGIFKTCLFIKFFGSGRSKDTQVAGPTHSLAGIVGEVKFWLVSASGPTLGQSVCCSKVN